MFQMFHKNGNQLASEGLAQTQQWEAEPIAGHCRPSRRMFRTQCVLLGLFLLVACGYFGGPDSGPTRAGVSGTVTVDGQPLEKGAITFTSSGLGKGVPQRTAGGEILDGKYSIAEEVGPLVGKQIVIITGVRKTRKTRTRFVKSIGGAEEQEEVEETEQYLPEKYNRNTALTAEVQAGGSTHDFYLTLN